MKLMPHIQEAVLGMRALVNKAVDARWDNSPFGTKPHAPREEYIRLFEATRSKQYSEIDEFERQLGVAIDKAWLDELALHTQIVVKKSDLGYPHGRILYSLLRWSIRQRDLGFVSILETGSARGFSSICMAKALADADVDGLIVTVDMLSHLTPQIWNCIDDHEGPKSRAEILAPWRALTQKILFLQADTLYMLPRIGIDRVHFAFLDAQHIESSVLSEFRAIASRQMRGDIVVFDDVTPSEFPGVVAAVSKIEAEGAYEVNRLKMSDRRAYAWARKL